MLSLPGIVAQWLHPNLHPTECGLCISGRPDSINQHTHPVSLQIFIRHLLCAGTILSHGKQKSAWRSHSGGGNRHKQEEAKKMHNVISRDMCQEPWNREMGEVGGVLG